MSNALSQDTESLIDDLQQAFSSAGGGQPSPAENVRRKWRDVALFVLQDKRVPKMTDERDLAITLHGIFLGEGHRTVMYERHEYDPAVLGWRGVARYLIARRPWEPRHGADYALVL